MDKGQLRTAVLGLDGPGQSLLSAAAESPHFDVVAIADKDLSLVERVAEGYGCEGTDDYRQLVIQHDLDCLLVGAPIYSCEGQVRAAIRKGVHVFKPAPPGRDFEETAELVRLAREAQVRFVVGLSERYCPTFALMGDHIRNQTIGHISLITAFCSLEHGPYPTWQNDPQLAGGGVLLRHCYGLVDQIVLRFGMPDQVYCLMTNQAADKQQRHYMTEDTALVAMRFADSLVADVVASRRVGTGQPQQYLRLYGRDGHMDVSHAGFAVYDIEGNAIERSRNTGTPQDRTAAALEDFALGLLQPDEHVCAGLGPDNLPTMAVVESAYLSSRTGFPEEPARVMGMT